MITFYYVSRQITIVPNYLVVVFVGKFKGTLDRMEVMRVPTFAG